MRRVIVIACVVSCMSACRGDRMSPQERKWGEEFRELDATCTAVADEIEHTLSLLDEGGAAAGRMKTEVMEPWKALRAKIDGASPFHVDKSVDQAIRRYVAERETEWTE